MSECPIGQKFERLTVQGYFGMVGGREHWICVCECGKRVVTRAGHVIRGNTRSCGCLLKQPRPWKRTHGLSKTPTWIIWRGMRVRCENPNNEKFKNYGARGIVVCERWQSFANFLADMGERPAAMTIERRDNDGNYEPGNCVWADAVTQARNKRNNRLETAFGSTKTVAEWMEDSRCSVGAETLKSRLFRGWPIERALTAPLQSPALRPGRVG